MGGAGADAVLGASCAEMTLLQERYDKAKRAEEEARAASASAVKLAGERQVQLEEVIRSVKHIEGELRSCQQFVNDVRETSSREWLPRDVEGLALLHSFPPLRLFAPLSMHSGLQPF